MSRDGEFELRERFEVERVRLLAARLLSLTGARTMVLSLDEGGDGVHVSCSTGWLCDLSDYVGDALCNADDLAAPLSEIV